jgi:hypothetical protein
MSTKTALAATTHTGNWSLVRAEGEKLVVSITGGDGQPREQTITFIDPDTISTSIPAPPGVEISLPQTATYRRVKQ